MLPCGGSERQRDAEDWQINAHRLGDAYRKQSEVAQWPVRALLAFTVNTRCLSLKSSGEDMLRRTTASVDGVGSELHETGLRVGVAVGARCPTVLSCDGVQRERRNFAPSYYGILHLRTFGGHGCAM